MTEATRTTTVLVMGVGNTLLKDDGIGIHVTEALKPRADYKIIDGGTIGLSLLPAIEDADAVIIVDASEIGEHPGSIRIFRNREIDRQLSGKKKTVHEVALRLGARTHSRSRGRHSPCLRGHRKHNREMAQWNVTALHHA